MFLSNRFEKIDCYDEALVYLRRALDVDPSCDLIDGKIIEINKKVNKFFFGFILNQKNLKKRTFEGFKSHDKK